MYPDRFYCFSCHSGGSVIDFTAAVFHLSPLDAVKRLNEDFSLGLSFGRMTDRERRELRRATRERERDRETLEAFERWKSDLCYLVTTAIRKANDAKKRGNPASWTAAEKESIKQQDWLSAVLDELNDDDPEKAVRLFLTQGEEVAAVCQRCVSAI